MFAAEPPQEPLPYGRWGDALGEYFERAAETGIGEISWFPDRTWAGRTYVPATAPAEDGGEVFGYVSYTREHEGAQATDFFAAADYTDETAAENPDWTLDLSDHEIGHWRGPEGRRGVITLVWGVALVANGVAATAELGPTTTDQCTLVRGPLHPHLGGRLHGRLHRGAALRSPRRGACARVPLRGRLVAAHRAPPGACARQ